MENLVPLGTGNSRLMKSNIPSNTTLAQLIQMWNNGTFPYDIGPLNSAGISQQGTPLNKDTLLKDATAALFGLGSDAVPDDVLHKISKYDVFEVGDILTTVRTDLDDKWLLCNGDTISRDEYPQLSGSIPAYPNGSWEDSSEKFAIFDYDSSDPQGYVAFDGTYYYMFTRALDGTDKVIRSIDGDTWTSISSYSTNNSLEGARILYANGKLAVAWVRSSRLYVYSTSLPAPSSMGSWTNKEVYYDSWYISLQEFKYVNGYYVLLVERSDNNTQTLWYSTDLVNWNGGIDFGSNGEPLGIAYGNGTYCILYRNNYADKRNPVIKYGADLSNVSNWVEKELSSDNYGTYAMGGIEYLNGKFIVVYGEFSADLYFTDNPASSWSVMDTPISLSRYGHNIKMKYFDGVYVFLSYAEDYQRDFVIYYTSDVSQYISAYSVENFFDESIYPLNIIKVGNIFRYIYTTTESNDQPCIKNRWMDASDIVLPTIAGSGDGAYAYIKAKE